MKTRYAFLLSLALGIGANESALAATCAVSVASIQAQTVVLAANCGSAVTNVTWLRNNVALNTASTFPATSSTIHYTTPLLSGVNTYTATTSTGTGATSTAAVVTGAQWLLTVAPTVGGSVTGSLGGVSNCTSTSVGGPLGANCSNGYDNGTAVVLTATADSGNGYSFSGWGGDCTGTGTCVVGMTAPRTVIANFNQGPVNAACGNQSATVNAPTATCSPGTPTGVTTTAAAYTWTCNGSNSGTSASCSAPRQYNVATSVGANGAISPSGATARTVTYNETTTFTVTPASGFSAVVTGCGGTLVGSTYTTGPITAGCTVQALFTNAPVNAACGDQTPTVNAPAATCSPGTPTGITTSSAAYAWTCNGTNGGNNASCSAPRQYNVDASAGANGTISPSGPAARTVTFNNTTSFTVTPNTGFTPTVGGTCGGSLAGATYTTNPITAGCTVAASFASSGGGGASCGPGEVFDTLLGDKDWNPLTTFQLWPSPAASGTGQLGRAIRFVADNVSYPNGLIMRIVDESIQVVPKDFVISACPHSFTPVGGNTKCTKTGIGSGAAMYTRYGPAINSYDCPLTPGATYYLNFRKYTTSGDYSGTVSSQFTNEKR